jgi:hypothetical protein
MSTSTTFSLSHELRIDITSTAVRGILQRRAKPSEVVIFGGAVNPQCGALHTREIRSGRLVKSFDCAGIRSVGCAVLSINQDFVITPRAIFEIESGKRVFDAGAERDGKLMSLHPDQTQVAIASDSSAAGTQRIERFAVPSLAPLTGAQPLPISVTEGEIIGLTHTADGRMLLVVTETTVKVHLSDLSAQVHEFRLADYATGIAAPAVMPPSLHVQGAALSPSNRFIALAFASTVTVVDFATGHRLLTLRAKHQSDTEPVSMQFLFDKLLLTVFRGSYGGGLRLWRLDDFIGKKPLSRVEHPFAPGTGATLLDGANPWAFSPEGGIDMFRVNKWKNGVKY